MRITENKIFAIAIVFVILGVLPLFASGSKDDEAIGASMDKSVLQIVENPGIGFGEGGGIGAGQRPFGFEEIDPGIIGDAPSKTSKIVAAELFDLPGVLTVKGSKGSRKFTLKSDDGKIYNIKVPSDFAETFATLKNKKITLQGVFYESEFLLFDMLVDK